MKTLCANWIFGIRTVIQVLQQLERDYGMICLILLAWGEILRNKKLYLFLSSAFPYRKTNSSYIQSI